MRLDLDFLRNLLLKIDSFDTFGDINSEELVDNDTSINKINAYLQILHEEDLIESMIDMTENEIYYIKYITLKGQKFIDNIKSKKVFDKYIKEVTNGNIYSLNEIIEYIIHT